MVGSSRLRFMTLLHRRLSTGAAPPTLLSQPATFGSHPVLFTTTFGVLYPSLAALSFIPVYGYFYFTDSSTAFLVGPYVTSLIRKPLPFSRHGRTVEDVLDNALSGFMKTSWWLWSKWKGGQTNERQGDEITTEILEELDAKGRWIDTARALRNHLEELKDLPATLQAAPRIWRKWTKGGEGEGEGEDVAREVPEDLQANGSWSKTTQTLMNHLGEMRGHIVAVQAEPRFWTKWTGEKEVEAVEEGEESEAEGGVDGIKREVPLQANESWKEITQVLMNRLVEMKDHTIAGLAEHNLPVGLNADKLREWKGQAIESLPGFDEVIAPKNGTMKAMTDAVAAYVVVKVSAPLRLAASLFFTPKVARLLERRWKAIFRK